SADYRGGTVTAVTDRPARLGNIAGRCGLRVVRRVHSVCRLLWFHAAAKQREGQGMKDAQSAPVPTGALLLAVVALIWIGMILGISGLATPIKFQAASLTLPVALDVGQTTFAAFNKMEWLLAAVLAIAVLPCRPALLSLRLLLTVAAVITVLLQTFWLLPALDQRVAAVIAGEVLPPSGLHNLYVVAEGVKLLALIVLGMGALWTLMARADRGV